MARTRKFADASALLHDLLDRHEEGTAQPIASPDYDAFANITATDAFTRTITEAERAGCVTLVHETGRRRGELKLVRLTDPAALYARLGRAPARDTAAGAGETMLNGLDVHPALREVALSAVDAWSRNRTWANLRPEHAASMRTAIILAEAIVDKRHLGLDYRTFSRRTTGDSKALEKLEGAVLRLVRAVVDLPPTSSARAAFAMLGLERFGPPLLLSGAFLLDHISVASSLPYLGVPPTEIRRISFSRPPAYVLTIENFASFSRYVTEADPDRTGLTLYIGGYPSLATQDALKELASVLLDDVLFFHWSDIDPDGTWIFRTIERAVGRKLLPHLMSRELADKFGEPSGQISRLRRGEAAGSMISDLVDYLAEPGSKVMEQEQIDPVIPEVVGCSHS